MKLARRIIDLLLFGNIYVALGAVCLYLSTVCQAGLFGQHYCAYSALVFFSTLFIYNFQRIFYRPQEDISLHSVRRKWIFENQLTIKVITFIAAAGASVSFFYNDFKIIYYFSPLLVLSLAYFLPFVKLRKSPWFKLLTLTLVWTMVTAVVPVLMSHHTNPVFIRFDILHIFVRFVFMIGICLPFDIRDMEIDRADNVSTIPLVMGERGTRSLAIVFMLLYIVLLSAEYFAGMFNLLLFIPLMISAVINTGFVIAATSKKSEYFFVAGLDGTMILQYIMILLALELYR
ncbi:MAG: hypothetical protein ACJ77K_14965 [Bacteroidia bacterium]